MLFYKNYIVYQNFYMFVLSELEVAITSPSFVALNLIVSEIANYIARGCILLVYKNYSKLFTCLYNQSYWLLSCHQVSLLYTFWFLR